MGFKTKGILIVILLVGIGQSIKSLDRHETMSKRQEAQGALQSGATEEVRPSPESLIGAKKEAVTKANDIGERIRELEDKYKENEAQLVNLGVPQSLNSVYLSQDIKREIYELMGEQAQLRVKLVAAKIERIEKEGRK